MLSPKPIFGAPAQGNPPMPMSGLLSSQSGSRFRGRVGEGGFPNSQSVSGAR